jgi:hypothetical protein
MKGEKEREREREREMITCLYEAAHPAGDLSESG